jgi:hypothetical protein
LPCGTKARQVASRRSPAPAVRRPCLVQQHRSQEAAHQSGMATPRRIAASAVAGSSPAAPAPEVQQQSVYVPVSELQDLCHKALRTLGYTEAELRALTDVSLHPEQRPGSSLAPPPNLLLHSPGCRSSPAGHDVRPAARQQPGCHQDHVWRHEPLPNSRRCDSGQGNPLVCCPERQRPGRHASPVTGHAHGHR